MPEAGVLIVAIVIGIPVIGGLLYAAFEKTLNTNLRLQELKVEEQRLRAEQALRTDELNAKILRMDDMGMSPTDIASLTEEIRQLREEVAKLKQEMNNRTVG